MKARPKLAVALGGACLSLLALAGPASAAMIAVTTTDDELNADGDCSLREAVQATNSNVTVSGCVHPGGGGLDTIVLAGTVYGLTLAGTDDSNALGDLDIDTESGGLAIDGVPGMTVIDGNGDGVGDPATTGDRVLHIKSGGFDLEGTVITDGVAPIPGGAGIYAQNPAIDGSLDIVNSVIAGNNATGSGGGLHAAGSGGATVTNSVIASNTGGGGGGIHVSNVGGLIINNSSINDNTASGAIVSGGGLSFFPGAASALTITNSRIVNNTLTATVQARGGGLITEGSSAAQSISSTVISENDAIGTGAGVTSSGGGLYIGASTPMTISDSLIHANTSTSDAAAANNGGGVSTIGNTKIQRSTISGNSLTNGTQAGGGIRDDASLVLVNSAVANNTATTGGGGGVRANGTATSIFNSTFSGNNATTGDAIHRNAGTLTLRGSVIDNAVAADACAGGITSLGFNVDVGMSCDLVAPAMGDEENVAPMLEAFGDWGGPDIGPTGNTQPLTTQPPQLASTAVEQFAGSGTTCQDETAAPLTTDERGFPRPFDGGGAATADCDAGSVEVYPCLGQNANQIGTAADNTLNGTAADDVIMGLGGVDTINAGDGNDRLCGNEGNDFLNGGDDVILEDFFDGGPGLDDELTYAAAAGPIDVNLNSPSSSGTGGDMTFDGIENLRGGAGPNILTGGAGNNDIRGGGGDDTLQGGSDDDLLDGEGNGGVGDTVSFTLQPFDAIIASLQAGTATGHGTDTIIGFENLRGGDANDNLTGDAGINQIEGGMGNDTIAGLGGMDTLTGEANDDSMFARDGVQDDVDCSGGIDTVETDAVGVDVIDMTCENVNFFVPPVIPPPAATPPAATPAPTTPTTRKCPKGRKLRKGKCVKKKKKEKR